MTHLCYTLEEAADKLKLTETVLVRLSQYFKVPGAAYEESGYLSFKGDLAFTEQDIDFFRQTKERLLLGESLEEVKSRMREPLASAQKSPPSNEEPRFAAHLTQSGGGSQAHQAHAPSVTQPDALRSPAEPMREIQDRQPYEKAAEQSFERYKSVHRTGLGRVFENMLKEVGVTRNEQKTETSLNFRPMRTKKEQEAGGSSPLERLLPFQRGTEAVVQDSSSKKVTAKRTSAAADPTWEQLLKQAVHQPRSLNSHLKGAAALLRERAIGQQASPGQSSRSPR